MRKLIALASAATLTLSGAAVHAQALEEITVTAQKREQGINDVGITVNAFTGAQLKDFGFSTAEDMALLTPGLTVNETAATGVPLYTIRGVGYQDYSTAASSTVGLYFDEVAIPYTVMSRGLMFDVERVEVLKGPQGDLYGRNTTAGQINFVSKRPTDEFEAGVTAGFGSFGTFDLEGVVSGPFSDTARGRIAVRTVQSGEGWQKSATRNDELGEKDTLAVKAMLDFGLGESANLLLNLHHVDDQSDNKANTVYDGTIMGISEFSSPYTPLDEYRLPTGANFGETPPWYSTGDNSVADWTNSYTSVQTGRTFDLRPGRDNQLTGIAAILDWDLGDITLTSITAWDQFDRVEANDWDGGFFNDSSNINTTDLSSVSQELRFSGGDDDLNWIAGVYFSSDEVDEYYHYFMSDAVFGNGSIPWNEAPFVLSPILELDTIYSQETDSSAVFGHMEWRFADGWRLTLGARYTSEKRKWSGCTFSADDGTLAGFLNTLFGATLGPGDCGTIDDDPNSPGYIFGLLGTPDINDAFHVFTDTIKTNRMMGKMTLDYAVNDDVLLYGTISNGFKSGGFNGANSNTTLQLQPIKEEVLTSYEFGAKATLAEGTVQLNAAAFFYDYEDKQEQDRAVTFVGNISGLTNVPKSEITGAELDLQWVPAEGWDIHLGVAVLDTKIKEWMAVDGAASSWPTVVRRDVSGQELAQSPDLQYSALVSKAWSVGGNKVVDASVDVSFIDDTTGGAQVEDSTVSYSVTSARIGYGRDDGQWRVLLWSRNTTDEYYYPSAYTGGNGPYIRSVGMPRTWGVSLDYKFGAY
ncbi:MAG: TonB-dependent receptor [Gammaproteobacteria bacterium]|nr:TonB-dependent receptor [Gammaproteobacteria bacterium]